MTADNYETIFELGFRSFPWTRVIQPIIFLTVGLLLIPLFKSKKFYFIVGVQCGFDGLTLSSYIAGDLYP